VKPVNILSAVLIILRSALKVEAAGVVETLVSMCHATQLHTEWRKH
jgi:hypothetical protein